MSYREKILDEIRFAYNNQKYYCTNCLLITLIEGVIISNDETITFASKNQIAKSLETKMDNYCKVLTYKVLKKHFYAGFGVKTGVTNNSSISRHAILHGYDTKFGSKKVFFKLLLLFADIVKTLSIHSNI